MIGSNIEIPSQANAKSRYTTSKTEALSFCMSNEQIKIAQNKSPTWRASMSAIKKEWILLSSFLFTFSLEDLRQYICQNLFPSKCHENSISFAFSNFSRSRLWLCCVWRQCWVTPREHVAVGRAIIDDAFWSCRRVARSRCAWFATCHTYSHFLHGGDFLSANLSSQLILW